MFHIRIEKSPVEFFEPIIPNRGLGPKNVILTIEQDLAKFKVCKDALEKIEWVSIRFRNNSRIINNKINWKVHLKL
jgi:hypothetical protein